MTSANSLARSTVLRAILTYAALALTFAANSAMAAGARSSSTWAMSVPGVTSIASAAQAAQARRATTAADSYRDDARERKHAAMLDKLRQDRRATMSATARAIDAAIPIPLVPGMRLSTENDSAFGFKGLSNVDSASVNLGYSTEPPDQALCVGNGFVFEGVNAAFAVYSEAGKLLAGPAQANDFFGVDFSLNVSDPRCYYDTASNRWFVTMTEYDSAFSDNHLMIAVSASGDPTGNFHLYDINVTGDGADFFSGDCPCLGDQPLIGADSSGFYITTNAFGQTSFQGAQVYAVSKAALAAGAVNPRVVHFDQLSSLLPDIEFAASIQPSTTPPGAKFAKDTEFLAQSMLALKKEERLAVWTVNNTSTIDGDSSKMYMSLAVTPSQVYVTPVPAEQKAGPTPLAVTVAVDDSAFPANEQDLDGNDQRLQQLTYLNGQLWTTVGTASVARGTPVRNAMAWFVVSVANTARGLRASIAAQGYVAGPSSSHLLYPSMAVNAQGEAAAVFNLTGPQFFPSAAYWKFGAHDFIHMLSDGQAAEDGFSAYYYGRPRWGDYSAAAAGPDGSIWVATESIPGGFRKTYANWGTSVGRTHRGEADDN